MLGKTLNSTFFTEIGKFSRLQFNGLFKILTPYTVNYNQHAFITGKVSRKDRPPRPPPFDYKNKIYRFWHLFTDSTQKRFDDNSKIVVVDGLPASGKDEFAKQLADELEMHYMPQPKFDDILIDAYGFDYRSLNSQLPIDVQFYDDKTFLDNPTGRNTAAIQHSFLTLRFKQYLMALTHVFSTGQGVVIQRCPWSDSVFMKAMRDCDYVSQGGYDYYRSACQCSLHYLFRPHLVIYLDVPVSIVQDRLRQRAFPHEANSKALTIKFLNSLEKHYKDSYLPTISCHAHSLVYDWTNKGNIEFVVDDIEQLQFDGYTREYTKMEDWRIENLDDQRAARDVFTNDQSLLISMLRVIRFDVPEMLISPLDGRERDSLITKLQEEGVIAKYSPGFNYDRDKGVFWKRAFFGGKR